MRFWEAMQRLEAGDKVRSKSWAGHTYIYMANGNTYSINLLGEANPCRSNFDIMARHNDWQVYEPPVTFKDIAIGEFFEYADGSGQCVKIKPFRSKYNHDLLFTTMQLCVNFCVNTQDYLEVKRIERPKGA